ncbi:hypothetical protein [Fodinicola feengrottensis]|uniref:hypothetical protein n=1 Tax=Fodinicola feengrottensis TaxID=435914 RepID=UPI0024413DBF|nr:hypothetical protein [Fodinicola feengrottensis]
MPDLFGWPMAAAHFLVTTLATLLSPMLAGASTVVAIVLFTVAVRLLLLPFSRAAVRGEKARAAVAPQTQEISIANTATIRRNCSVRSPPCTGNPVRRCSPAFCRCSPKCRSSW